MSRPVLVTGIAGFIGARTASFLAAAGESVIGLDNLNSYYDVRLKEHRLKQLERQGNVRFIKGDVEDPQALEALFREYRFERVYHLAARAGVRYSMENPFVYLTTNALGTLNLLELMRRHAVRKMVLASTSSLYAGQRMPFTEDLPVNTPISPYAASKKAAETMAYSYHYLYGLDISVVRYFTVYGPAGRPDMSVFRFVRWIDEGRPLEVFGDGSQTRDFTYVDDIAHGTVLSGKEVGYEIINLGGGRRPVSLQEVIARLEHALGKKAIIERKPFHAADLRETGADISKAKRLLGWEPVVDVDEGLERTVQWYLENRTWLSGLSAS